VVNATPPAALPPGKAIIYEAGWAPGPVWTGAEDLAPPHWEPQIILHVTSKEKNSDDVRSHAIGAPLPIHKPGVV